MNQVPLIELQDHQRQHDELAHTDILCLTVRDRMKHMVLHYAKYAGRLYSLKSDDFARISATVVDTFIICLATANTLNIDLQQRLSNRSKVLPFDQGMSNQKEDDRSAFDVLVGSLIVEAGKMAKACESLDHLEKYDYRAVLEEGTIGLTKAVLEFAQDQGIDLRQAVATRWRQVEEKSIFSSMGKRNSHLVPKRKA